MNFCPIFLICSAIYTLVCISFERHRAILDSHGSQWSTQKLVVLITLIWTFALAVSVPTILEYSVDVYVLQPTAGNNTTSFSCASVTSKQFSMANFAFVLIVAYIIPLILMLRNYLQMALFLWKMGERMRQTSESSLPKSANFLLLRHRFRLVKLLIMVAVIFAVSWLPFFAMLCYAVRTVI